MTASELELEFKTLPEEERAKFIGDAFSSLSLTTLGSLERRMRRVAHPEVPEDVWVGFEEGRGLEINDKHFGHPPF